MVIYRKKASHLLNKVGNTNKDCLKFLLCSLLLYQRVLHATPLLILHYIFVIIIRKCLVLTSLTGGMSYFSPSIFPVLCVI